MASRLGNGSAAGTMRRAFASLLAVAALAAGIAFAAISTAVAQVDDAADCADRFGFARNPVPVAKTADGQQVLASVKWGYSPGLCYLVLDEAAVHVLRNNPPTGSAQVTTPADRTAADRCHSAHNPNHGFARNPVPVAKSADGQQVLGSVKWGYTNGLCYLVLDDNAVQALRTNPPTISSADTLPIPANPHSRVGVGSFHFCYLGSDDTALCPNASQFYGQALTGAPGGQFAAISSGYRHSCGLRNDGTVECWGDDQYGPYLAPDGKFASVSAGSAFSCGLRTTGAIECWGHQDDDRELVNDERLDAPSGQFAAISAGNNYACGLRTNGTIACWGTHWAETLSPPSGRFTAISAGEHQACGLRVDGTLKCWGSVRSAPGGQFTSVSVGALHSCGIRADGTVECWGRNESGEAEAPEGQFTEISAGGFTSCGLRADQIAFCWGWIKRPFTGTVDIHVFYCAAQSAAYSNADLQQEVQALDDNVGAFFERHSAGLFDLNFIPGGVVSPDIQWDQYTLSDLATGNLYGEPCRSEAIALGDYSQLIMLINLEPDDLSGFAVRDGEIGEAVTTTLEARYSRTCSHLNPLDRVINLDDEGPCSVSVYERHYYVITHEIGHSVFGLEHDLDCSVMSYSCPDYTRLGCTHLIFLGWPHESACEQDRLLRNRTGGNFIFVQQGHRFYCGLRTDGTIACWGINDYGQANAPSGAFNSLAVSNYHACGLRTEGTIACWGRNNYGQTNAPSGTFTWVQTWPSYSCGLRNSGAIECWGDQTIGKVKSYTPGGTLTAISAGGVHWCALRDDQTIACDGIFPAAETNPPNGRFIGVYAGGSQSCGWSVANKYICWGSRGDNPFAANIPPGLAPTSLVHGSFHACGLRTDQTIACWIWDRDSDRRGLNYGQEIPPPGQFTVLASGGFDTCGLRTDRTIACWGQNAFQGRIRPPEGEFTAISGNGTFCGLRTDQTIACWGQNHLGQADPPNGQFTAISHTGVHGCGLRTDQTIACWGQNASGETDAPSGHFIAVSAGSQHSCGIRADRTTVVCWGTVPA